MKRRIALFAAMFIAAALWAGTARAVPGTNPLPRTGQGEGAKCYNTANGAAVEIPCLDTHQDGETRKGVAWPSGDRFTDNTNGTVTDNLTGLIWLKDATCFGIKNWNDATNLVAGLAHASCGLSDGSAAGNWRLPNVRELESLIDLRYSKPALTAGHPFTLPAGNYTYTAMWTSTSYAPDSSFAYKVTLYDGTTFIRGDSEYGGFVPDDYGNYYGPTLTSKGYGSFVLPVKNMP